TPSRSNEGWKDAPFATGPAAGRLAFEGPTDLETTHRVGETDMNRYRRREFLADVGRGMMVAGVGSALAQELGLVAVPAVLAGESAGRLTFGAMEPLVALMQETPADRLLPAVVARINEGTDLRRLVAAAALANARTFGGQDYEGYHTIMALAPS